MLNSEKRFFYAKVQKRIAELRLRAKPLTDGMAERQQIIHEVRTLPSIPSPANETEEGCFERMEKRKQFVFRLSMRNNAAEDQFEEFKSNIATKLAEDTKSHATSIQSEFVATDKGIDALLLCLESADTSVFASLSSADISQLLVDIHSIHDGLGAKLSQFADDLEAVEMSRKIQMELRIGQLYSEYTEIAHLTAGEIDREVLRISEDLNSVLVLNRRASVDMCEALASRIDAMRHRSVQRWLEGRTRSTQARIDFSILQVRKRLIEARHLRDPLDVQLGLAALHSQLGESVEERKRLTDQVAKGGATDVAGAEAIAAQVEALHTDLMSKLGAAFIEMNTAAASRRSDAYRQLDDLALCVAAIRKSAEEVDRLPPSRPMSKKGGAPSSPPSVSPPAPTDAASLAALRAEVDALMAQVDAVLVSAQRELELFAESQAAAFARLLPWLLSLVRATQLAHADLSAVQGRQTDLLDAALAAFETDCKASEGRLTECVADMRQAVHVKPDLETAHLAALAQLEHLRLAYEMHSTEMLAQHAAHAVDIGHSATASREFIVALLVPAAPEEPISAAAPEVKKGAPKPPKVAKEEAPAAIAPAESWKDPRPLLTRLISSALLPSAPPPPPPPKTVPVSPKAAAVGGKKSAAPSSPVEALVVPVAAPRLESAFLPPLSPLSPAWVLEGAEILLGAIRALVDTLEAGHLSRAQSTLEAERPRLAAQLKTRLDAHSFRMGRVQVEVLEPRVLELNRHKMAFNRHVVSVQLENQALDTRAQARLSALRLACGPLADLLKVAAGLAQEEPAPPAAKGKAKPAAPPSTSSLLDKATSLAQMSAVQSQWVAEHTRTLESVNETFTALMEESAGDGPTDSLPGPWLTVLKSWAAARPEYSDAELAFYEGQYTQLHQLARAQRVATVETATRLRDEAVARCASAMALFTAKYASTSESLSQSLGLGKVHGLPRREVQGKYKAFLSNLWTSEANVRALVAYLGRLGEISSTDLPRLPRVAGSHPASLIVVEARAVVCTLAHSIDALTRAMDLLPSAASAAPLPAAAGAKKEKAKVSSTRPLPPLVHFSSSQVGLVEVVGKGDESLAPLTTSVRCLCPGELFVGAAGIVPVAFADRSRDLRAFAESVAGKTQWLPAFLQQSELRVEENRTLLSAGLSALCGSLRTEVLPRVVRHVLADATECALTRLRVDVRRGLALFAARQAQRAASRAEIERQVSPFLRGEGVTRLVALEGERSTAAKIDLDETRAQLAQVLTKEAALLTDSLQCNFSAFHALLESLPAPREFQAAAPASTSLAAAAVAVSEFIDLREIAKEGKVFELDPTVWQPEAPVTPPASVAAAAPVKAVVKSGGPPAAVPKRAAAPPPAPAFPPTRSSSDLETSQIQVALTDARDSAFSTFRQGFEATRAEAEAAVLAASLGHKRAASTWRRMIQELESL